jgi:hypothetical protein
MANKDKSVLTRREILKTSVIAGGITLAGFHNVRLPAFFGQVTKHSFQGGQYLGSIEFVGESPMPMDIPMGTGLDGRLYTDLSAVGPDNPVTPNDKFYIRTRASELLEDRSPWLIKVTGLVKQPINISLADLKKLSKPAGLHLLECSGNVRDAHFGMLSVADWAGVPVSAILDSLRIQKAASRIDLRLRSIPRDLRNLLARSELDIHSGRTQVIRGFSRHCDEWSPLTERPRRSNSPGSARLVWMHVHQVGR